MGSMPVSVCRAIESPIALDDRVTSQIERGNASTAEVLVGGTDTSVEHEHCHTVTL